MLRQITSKEPLSNIQKLPKREGKNVQPPLLKRVSYPCEISPLLSVVHGLALLRISLFALTQFVTK